MTEHKGASFIHSCVKVPLDPYSRQPTPAYERPKLALRPELKTSLSGKTSPAATTPCRRSLERCNKLSGRMDNRFRSELESIHDDYLDYMAAMPDYEDAYHLSNEQFKQKLDYLKRRQRLLLKNLRNCLEQVDELAVAPAPPLPPPSLKSEAASPTPTTNRACSDKSCADLALKGRRCNFEESRSNSPLLYPSGSFSCLAEDQDLLAYRCKEHDKAAKMRCNEKILSAGKCWSSTSESKSPESDEQEIKAETKSLPPHSPKKWLPTLTEPFDFTHKEDAEKYITMAEQQEFPSYNLGKKNPTKKRRIRPVPLTSKIPLYDKLMAEKEERSRVVRRESTLNLLSQVRPFKLECDRRALRALTRSSPELGKRPRGSSARFRAKPVPRNLFSTDVYDRMLEDEYFRHLQKRIRAAELLKSASLPPSMARRERCRSAVSLSRQTEPRSSAEPERSRSCSSLGPGTPFATERTSCSAMLSTLPPHGNNLAAILRAQASREKLEREIQERLEEKRREQMIRLRKALISRKPAWRALRFAARHEHERDLDFRAMMRRDEAREQAERHRLQMEMMLDRVTRIPTLFERYSQSFRNAMELRTKLQEAARASVPTLKKKKKVSTKRQSSSSTESYISVNSNGSRPNSGSPSSSSSSPPSLYRTSVSRKPTATEKKRQDRGPLKVSINETAELIEDRRRSDLDDKESFDEVDSAKCELRDEDKEQDTTDSATSQRYQQHHSCPVHDEEKVNDADYRYPQRGKCAVHDEDEENSTSQQRLKCAIHDCSDDEDKSSLGDHQSNKCPLHDDARDVEK